MWPAMDLENRGVFMELGSPRLVGGVPGTEGAQNGVSSERKKKKKEEQKSEGEEKKGKEKKRRERKKKKKRFSRSR